MLQVTYKMDNINLPRQNNRTDQYSLFPHHQSTQPSHVKKKKTPGTSTNRYKCSPDKIMINYNSSTDNNVRIFKRNNNSAPHKPAEISTQSTSQWPVIGDRRSINSNTMTKQHSFADMVKSAPKSKFGTSTASRRKVMTNQISASTFGEIGKTSDESYVMGGHHDDQAAWRLIPSAIRDIGLYCENNIMGNGKQFKRGQDQGL